MDHPLRINLNDLIGMAADNVFRNGEPSDRYAKQQLLATVFDCYSKKVADWAMTDHFQTSLIEAAMDMATVNVDIAENAIFHPIAVRITPYSAFRQTQGDG